MIIDFHTHCFPEDMAYKVVPVLADMAGIKPCLTGTIDELKESMVKAGIDCCVLQNIATRPQQTKTINSWAAQVQDDMIISFGSLHPDYTDWEEELERIEGLGIKGLKFHPDYQKFVIDDEKMYKIYEKIFSLDLIILFHAGLDIGLEPPYHCTPDRLLKVINLFPEGKIIAAHMGSYAYWKQVEELLAGKNIFFDTSYSYNDLGKEKMSRLIELHGADKVIFGTDSPWTDQSKELQNFNSLDLTPEEKHKILGDNALKLLNLR